MKDHCEACLHNGSFYILTPDHIKTLGSGGSDDWTNILTLCLNCHGFKGSQGLSALVERFPRVREALVSRGWEYDHFRAKWVRYEFME